MSRCRSFPCRDGSRLSGNALKEHDAALDARFKAIPGGDVVGEGPSAMDPFSISAARRFPTEFPREHTFPVRLASEASTQTSRCPLRGAIAKGRCTLFLHRFFLAAPTSIRGRDPHHGARIDISRTQLGSTRTMGLHARVPRSFDTSCK